MWKKIGVSFSFSQNTLKKVLEQMHYLGKSNYVQHTQACNFIKKETPLQLFSCEFFEISRTMYFAKHIQTAASCYNQHLRYSD